MCVAGWLHTGRKWWSWNSPRNVGLQTPCSHVQNPSFSDQTWWVRFTGEHMVGRKWTLKQRRSLGATTKQPCAAQEPQQPLLAETGNNISFPQRKIYYMFTEIQKAGKYAIISERLKCNMVTLKYVHIKIFSYLEDFFYGRQSICW